MPVQQLHVAAGQSEMDAAHAITDLNTPPRHHYPGTGNTVYVAYKPTGADPVTFINFDLVSETWGTPYGDGAGSPTTNAVAIWALFRRPDQSLLVVYGTSGFNIGPAKASTLFYQSYDPLGDTWSSVGDPGANWVVLPAYGEAGLFYSVGQYTSGYFIPCDGTAVLIFQVLSTGNHTPTPLWDGRVFSQVINPDNSLGGFFDFPGQDASPQLMVDRPSIGSVLVLRDKVVLGVTQSTQALVFPDDFPTIYVGTPLNNPIWTLKPGTSGIDAAAVGDATLQPESPTFLGGSIDAITGTMYFVWSVADAAGVVPYARIRRSTCTNLAFPLVGPWTAETIYDMTVDGPPGFFPLPDPSVDQIIALLSLSITPGMECSCNNPPAGEVGAPYSHDFSASGGVAPYTFMIEAGALPPGLSLDSSGHVSGAPTTIGTSSFTVEAIDSVTSAACVQCSIEIGPGVQSIKILLRGHKIGIGCCPPADQPVPAGQHVKRAM